jgi:hypothetical protein
MQSLLDIRSGDHDRIYDISIAARQNIGVPLPVAAISYARASVL